MNKMSQTYQMNYFSHSSLELSGDWREVEVVLGSIFTIGLFLICINSFSSIVGVDTYHRQKTEHSVDLGRQVGVQCTVLVNVVLVMASEAIGVASQGAEGVLTGQGEVAIEAHVVRDPVVDDPPAPAVSVTHDGVAGNLVDWMTIVGVVLDWDSTHAGGNCWQIKSKFIPEKSVRPVDGGVGLHVVAEVGVKIAMRNVSEDEDDGTTSGLEDVVEGGADVVAGPLVDDVVVGQHDDGPLAVAGRLADGVRHVRRLWEIRIVQTYAVRRISVFKFGLRTCVTKCSSLTL